MWGGSGEKRQVRGIPVALHEAFQIAVVPGLHLRNQQVFDLLLQVGADFPRQILLLSNRRLFPAGCRLDWRMNGLSRQQERTEQQGQP